MALNEQQKRVPKNRVSITYDVEIGNAVETVELPFIVGVLGDFSADKEEREPLHERNFIDLDKDNFDSVLERIAPRLQMKVENTLEGDDSVFEADISFKSMKDFEPEALIDKPHPSSQHPPRERRAEGIAPAGGASGPWCENGRLCGLGHADSLRLDSGGASGRP